MLSLSKHVRWACLLLLAGCAKPGVEQPKVQPIDCALVGASDFTKQCTIEGDTNTAFIIHHPDGGFRRFLWGRENGVQVLQSADGADRAQVKNRYSWPVERNVGPDGQPDYGQESGLEIRVGDDRYFLVVESPME